MKEYNKNRLNYLVKDHGKNALNLVERVFPRFYNKVFSPENSRGTWEKVEYCDYSYELMKGSKILATIAGEYAPLKGKEFTFWTYQKPTLDKKNLDRNKDMKASNHDLTEEGLEEFNQLLNKLRFAPAPFN